MCEVVAARLPEGSLLSGGVRIYIRHGGRVQVLGDPAVVRLVIDAAAPPGPDADGYQGATR